ncbi:MAG: alkyl/aryl-sulfatase [Halieaceae bacterium]
MNQFERIKAMFYPLCFVGLLQAVSTTASDVEAPTPTQRLQAQNAEFEKELIQVAPNVYTGVGYAGSNASMIVGSDGVIIIDTLPGLAAAESLRADFLKVSDKPVKAIIYTHGHMDHVGGAKVFADDDAPDIYARSNSHVDRIDAGPRNSFSAKRAARQFGRTLKPGVERINLGVGPAVQPMGGFGQGTLAPTISFASERQRLTIAGIQVELVAAPGETDDQLYVWLPESKVLFSGDNFYRSFPNIYALRGTPYRDIIPWANSLEKMAGEKADALVPGHTRPVKGADEIQQTLTDYRDAIRFVHDKTVEGMNKGLVPDELVDYVKLPESLASRHYLTEFYGRVDTAVRAVFSGYVGWFDGNPTNLSNLSPKGEASRMAALAGGEEALLNALLDAQREADHVWALRLADHLIAMGSHRERAIEAKIESLRVLAEETLNAPTRNYYLSVANELGTSVEAD